MNRQSLLEAASALGMVVFCAGFPIALFMIGTSR